MSAEDIRNWTEEEDAQLMEMKYRQVPAQEIADKLGRTVNAVNFRAYMIRKKDKDVERLAKGDPLAAFPDVPIEEYSEEEMRAATRLDVEEKRAGEFETTQQIRQSRVDNPSVSPKASHLPLHKGGKKTCNSGRVMLTTYKPFDESRLAREIREAVEALIEYVGSEEDCRTKAMLQLGRLDVLTAQLSEWPKEGVSYDG